VKKVKNKKKSKWKDTEKKRKMQKDKIQKSNFCNLQVYIKPSTIYSSPKTLKTNAWFFMQAFWF
jgi:hypothetical protein